MKRFLLEDVITQAGMENIILEWNFQELESGTAVIAQLLTLCAGPKGE